MTCNADDLRIELHFIGGPAHTNGDVVAWIPERSVLLAGDLIFNGGALLCPHAGSVTGALAGLERLRAFDAATIVPGLGSRGREAIDAVRATSSSCRRSRRRALRRASRRSTQAVKPISVSTTICWIASVSSATCIGYMPNSKARRPVLLIDLAAAFRDMIAFNGGRPLRCLA